MIPGEDPEAIFHVSAHFPRVQSTTLLEKEFALDLPRGDHSGIREDDTVSKFMEKPHNRNNNTVGADPRQSERQRCAVSTVTSVRDWERTAEIAPARVGNCDFRT